MAQVGTALVVTAEPEITGVKIIKGTWRERDNAEQEETATANDGTINVTTDDPGVDATCEWVLTGETTPKKKGDTVTDDGDRIFVVVEAETFNFGAKATKQSVTLRYKESLSNEMSA